MLHTPSSRFIVIASILITLAAIAVNANWGSGFGFGMFKANEAATASENTAEPVAPQLEHWLNSQPPAAAMTTPLNAITSFDMYFVARAGVGFPVFPTNEHKVAGDASGNCTISVSDTIPMFNYVLGSAGAGTVGTTLTPPGPCPALPITVSVVRGDPTGVAPIITGGSGSASVSLPHVSATPGLIIVPITVSDLTGLGVVSYDLQVNFDPSVITPASPAYSQAGTVSSSMGLASNAANSGHLIIGGISSGSGSPLSGAGTLLDLRFNVVGTEGQSTALTFADYTDPLPRAHQSFLFNEGLPDVVTTNGSVTIGTPAPTDTPTPTATDTPTDTPTPTPTDTPTATNTVTASPTPGCNAVVFETDFESGLQGFSGAGFITGVQGYSGLGTAPNTFGGNFLTNETSGPPVKASLTLMGLPSHTGIDLRFLLAIINSWDGVGCDPSACPDSFNVAVDGSVVFSHVFENSGGGTQSYVPPLNVELARHAPLFGQNGSFYNDSAYDMGQDPVFSNIPHSSSTLTIDWFASGPGWEGLTNESWAIENVKVSLVGGCAGPTATATPTPTGSPGCYPTPSNLILWHKAEGNANDTTGNSPGVLQGDTTFTTGKVGQAYSFDGSGDFVNVPGSFGVGSSEATVDAWIKTSALSGDLSQAIVSAGGSWFVDLRLGALTYNPQLGDTFNRGVLVHTNAGAIYVGNISESPIGLWRHIALTTKPGEQRVYENGVLVAMNSVSYSVFGINTNLTIGRGIFSAQYFHGQIDEVEIFNRALSQAEIQGIYNAGSAGKCMMQGTITYGNAIGNPIPPRFVQNVTLASTAGSPAVGQVITGTSGQYTLGGFGAGSYTITPSKPGGSNPAINSFDAAKIARHASGIELLTGNQLPAADVTGNGGINSFDAGKIAGYVVGLPIVPPNLSGTWRFYVNPVIPFPPLPPSESRTYASITSYLAGEDYTALLMGDVSGNWNPAIHPRPVGSGNYAGGTGVAGKDAYASVGGPERGVAVELPQFKAAADKKIVVPVNVQGVANKGVISYEFDLRYDPAVIQPLENPVDIAGTVSRGLFAVANPYEPGLLRVVVYGPMPIDDNGVLLNLRFTAVGAVGSTSPLTWERIMFNEGESGVSAVDGRVELF